jgi:hypothetical protein
MDDDDDIPISPRLFPLEKIPTSDLVHEIKRREAAKRELKFRPCDECRFFIPWTKSSDPPTEYNPCAKLHQMSFRMPDSDDTHSTAWGFYRRPCPDYKKDLI